VNSQQRVQAYDPATGRELWRCGGTTYEVIPTPVVGYGMVFCSSGRAGPTLAIRPGGKGDVTRSHVAWSSPRGSPFVPSPILFGDALYMVNDMASIVTSLDARTGAPLAGAPGVAQQGASRSPVAVDGRSSRTTMARRSCCAPARRSS
jgi:outer membrane protein assembly factor BamB